MVLAGAAYGQVRSADVLYTFHESVPSPGYRVGDECFVAVETAEQWGWKVKTDGTMANVDAEGHTIRLSVRFLADRTTIPLRAAVKQLGGNSDWTSGTDTLNVFSTLSEVTVSGGGNGESGVGSRESGAGGSDPTTENRQSNTLNVASGHIEIRAPLAFKANPFYLNPGQTVIDLDGVRLGPDTKQTLPDGARAEQYRTNVVRITLATPFVPKLPEAGPESNEFTLDIAKDPVQPLPENPVPAQTPTTTATTQAPQTGPIEVSLDQDTASTTTLGFHMPGFRGEATINQPDPDTLEITLPGVATGLADGYKSPTGAIESLTSRTEGNATVITLKLARPMGSEITSSFSGVTLSLMKPNVGDGRLAGKVIVVDPGHGGHDRGAHDGGVNEKDLTLSIGKQLARKLAEAGANVIMTRQTDVFIPLVTRSEISNSNHADFFVSCHINSTGDSSRQSGTITFHHEGNKVGYLLSLCIQHEIAKVNRLPNLGSWSDGRIYASGFSVLRHTKAPAVLIEYGFINNPHDRAHITTDEFQDAVTTAVVKGIRVFLGESKSNG